MNLINNLILDKIAIAQLKTGHRIYGMNCSGEVYFYEPGMKRWVLLISKETPIATQEEYQKYRDARFGKKLDE
jgi:hypothetical protein